MGKDPCTTLPTLVALPLARADVSSGQRKDHLRVAFENLMGLIGAIVVGDLLDRVGQAEQAEEPGEAEVALLQCLAGEEGEALLTGVRAIGLEQMSLGKWVALLRAVGALVEKIGFDPAIPEAVSLYASRKKEIDELVRLRNEDAHGPAIPPDQLDAVLDQRRAMILRIVESCGFFDRWQLVQFDRFDIEGDLQVHRGTVFAGAEPAAFRRQSNGEELPLGQPLLLEQSGRCIDLSPLLITAPITGGGGVHAAIFSKEIKGDPNHLSFVGCEGATALDLSQWTEAHGPILEQRRRLQRRMFSAPAVRTASLSAEVSIDATRLVVGDEPTDLVVVVANGKGGADVEQASAVIALPSCLRFGDLDGEGLSRIDDRRCEWSFDLLAAGDRRSVRLPVIATEHGAESIPAVLLEFRYRRTEDSVEPDAEGVEEIDGLVIEAIDHAFEDPIRPIVNAERAVIPMPGGSNIEIGDTFEFRLRLTNQGLGRAESVTTVIVPSEGLVLLDGDPRVNVSLAPGDERTLKWSLRAERHGVHQIRVSDLVYADLDGRLYVTECSEERQFLVRADKRKQLGFTVREVMSDLVVTKEEEAIVRGLVEGLREVVPDPEERAGLLGSVESDAIVKVVRDLVREAFRGRPGVLRESMHTETSWQEKRHPDRGRRKVLAYFLDDVPVFAIDVTENAQGSPSFHSAPVPGLTDREPFVVDESLGVFPDSRTLNGTLHHSLFWRDIRMDSGCGIGLFKQWLARLAAHQAREMAPWRAISRTLAESLGGRVVYQRRRFELVLPDEIKSTAGLKDTGGSIRSRMFCGVVVPDPARRGGHLAAVVLGNESNARPGSKWMRDRLESGGPAGAGLWKVEDEGPGVEPGTSGLVLLGMPLPMDGDPDAVAAVGRTLRSEARKAYLREVPFCATSRHRKSTVDIFEPDRIAVWWTPRLDALAEHGIVARVSLATRSDIHESLELVLPDVGVHGGDRLLGRIVANKGVGSCWITWFDGMADDHPVLDRISIDESEWNVVEKTPGPIATGLLHRVGDDPMDDASLSCFLDAVIEGCKGGEPAWPSSQRDRMVALVRRVEPRLAELESMLASGPKSVAELCPESDPESRPRRLALNRLLNWRDRYDRPSPIRLDAGLVSLQGWIGG